jgi:hypothetical protein
MQAQARRVDGLVQPLHARGAARIASQRFRALGSRTPRAPEREDARCDDHHNQ